MLIKGILKQHRWRFIYTITLILAEALLSILFPLFIGNAIGDVLNKEMTGLWQLAILGFLLIVMGSFRRMLDSRFYARIYTTISGQTITQIPQNKQSVKTARLHLLSEMVKFAENQLPDIIQHSIGLIGVMSIIAFLNLNIFFGTLIAGSIVVLIYLLSGEKTFRYNKGYNNELESQLDVLSTNQPSTLKLHLLKLMRWNIKLSDIETINYALSWLIMIVLLVLAIRFAATRQQLQYGTLFALIMYVYQYIESMLSLPLYYQQWLRLKEISQRLQRL